MNEVKFGWVTFTKGKSKGLFGYYDSDEYSFCIVRMPVIPMKYVRTRKSSIRNLSKFELDAVSYKFPNFVRKLGLH